MRLAALLIGSAMASAQAVSTIELSNSVELRVEANLGQPTGQQTLKVELARASGNSFYRIFRDQNNLTVFAYELVVNRSADGSDFRFSARPAAVEFAARFPNADGGKPVPSLSTEQNLRAVRSGEKAEVGLFEIPGMGLRVTDSVHVRMNPAGTGAGQIRFAGLRVSANGTAAVNEARRTPVSGRYAMFYIPGKGGYFFSTELPVDRTNFLKAGAVDGSRMKFSIDNDEFEVTAAEPILPGSGSGEVWVFHDPSYRPSGNWTQVLQPDNPLGAVKDEFFAAAADSLNWWMR